jgi:acyl-CoA dehydrogenase
MGWVWLLGFIVALTTLAYHRASLKVWTFAMGVFLILLTRLSNISFFYASVDWIIYLAIFIPLNILSWRYKFISQPALAFYRKTMPTMSRTEREALAAGTVGWEGDLFRGNPNWVKFLALPQPKLSVEEKAFIDGPLETLCGTVNDWDITYNRADLPPEMWEYLKEQGFFGLNIPKEFGGKEFSAYSQSQILSKLYSCSATLATTVAVPNSLGPAELLFHYGTEEQKQYYLPRLARGEEIPCFALTGPDAGSDASAMQDIGIVCWDEMNGEKTLGIRLNWNKRYITLAPVATLIGLAFKLYDPDKLLGPKEDLGITCALIPRNTAGITIGRRHLPANTVFQNGPTQGKNVFIPVDWIIGGPKMAGQGWRMLMECLAAGRAISLPSSATGGAKALAFGSGAYSRIRRQFNVPIGRFEGIEEALARIGGYTYIIDATRSFTAALIDAGEKPAVASAITKYHTTELSRLVGINAMDLHGGKAVCIGPRNYVSPFYQSAPIAITVEGANILTRSLIIFGQGAMRCHPYVFAEFEAAQLENSSERLAAFDQALIGHMSFTFSNLIRSFVMGCSSSRIVIAPKGKTKRYFQHLTRFSSAFALLADTSLLVLGGALKRKESLSARLGDILSDLYLMSAVLKHYHNQGKHAEDLPLVRWSCETLLYRIQESMKEILANFPSRILSGLLRFFIFPFGYHFAKPRDELGFRVAHLLMAPTASRARLTEVAYTTNTPGNALGLFEDALIKIIAAEPVEKTIKSVQLEELIQGDTLLDQAKAAYARRFISKEQLDIIVQAEEARQKVIAVDDFAPEDLGRSFLNNHDSELYARENTNN